MHITGQIKIEPAEFLGELFIPFQETILANGAYRRVEGHKRFYMAPPERWVGLHNALSELFDVYTPDTVTEAVAKADVERQRSDEVHQHIISSVQNAGFHLPVFQIEDIDRIRKERSILDRKEAGLGKTVTDILSVPPRSRVLVITLASMKYTYADEIVRWRAPFEIVKPWVCEKTLDGMEWGDVPDWKVYNYERLPSKRWCETVFPRICQEGLVVIVDEAHKACHEDTQIYAKLIAICHTALDKGGKVILASGTPMQNHPGEFWNVLELARLGKQIFKTKKNYIHKFGGIEGEAGIIWGTPEKEVPSLLHKHIIIRHKKDCLHQLPKTRTQYIPCRVNVIKAKKFERVWNTFQHHIEEGKPLGEVLALCQAGRLDIPFEEYARIRGELALLKVDAMKEIVRTYIESETPLIVASNHLSPLRALQQMEEGVGDWGDCFPVLEGKTPAKERKRIIDNFQAGRYPVLGLSISAGGTGITLTRANTMLFVDLHWNPAVNGQCMARIDRIGQLCNSLLYMVLVASHPLDIHVTNVLLGKESRISATFGGSTLVRRLICKAKEGMALTDREKAYLRKVVDTYPRR